MSRLGAWALVALALAGCGPFEPEETEGGADEDALPAGLTVATCRPGPALIDVSGVYAARFETVAPISGGSLKGAQTEIVTRYAAIQLCQDGTTIDAVTVVCGMHHSPLYDQSDTCAAQVPSAALLRALPALHSRGLMDPSLPEAGFSLPWAERWGLDETSALPTEPAGAAPLESEAVVDADGDEYPGVTVKGSGPVPTVAWVARLTEASLNITGGDGVVLQGNTRAATAEVVVGGPASRWLRGRSRGQGDGQLDLVRVDGRDGAPALVQSGRLTCAEVIGLIGPVFSGPRITDCE